MGEFLDSLAQETANRQRLAQETPDVDPSLSDAENRERVIAREGTFFDPMVGGGTASKAGTAASFVGREVRLIQSIKQKDALGIFTGIFSIIGGFGGAGGGLLATAVQGGATGATGNTARGANLMNIVSFGGMNRRAQDLFDAEAAQIQEVNRVNAMEQIARSREASAQAVAKLTSQSIL
jgi:hypothetical protein